MASTRHSQPPAKQVPSAQPKPTASQRFWREVRGYAEALVIAYLVVTFLFNTVGVVGSSMQPTLDGGTGQLPQSLFLGDRVFIPKYDNWLRRAGILPPFEHGEIVVIREPANSPTAPAGGQRPFFIKRVIGQPGDRVRVEAGQVYVNGYALDQTFISDGGRVQIAPINFPEVIVQDGEIVELRGLSYDPRSNQGSVGPPDDPTVQFFYGTTLAALAPLPDEVVAQSRVQAVRYIPEIIVPEGHYFLMGDNRSFTGSVDSRFFGPIPSLSVAGQASAVIWPPRRDGGWNWRLLSPPPTFQEVPAREPAD